MNHVRQTVFGVEAGNCYPACISMVTDIPIEEIPNFCDGGKNPNWWGDTALWLADRGWCGVYMSQEAWGQNHACLWSVRHLGHPIIVSGKSPRFDCDHCVVLADGRQFDPHPDDLGIGEEFKDAIVLFPLRK